MVGVMRVYGALLQIPGLEAPDLTLSEQASVLWGDMGFMRWPLAICVLIGIVVIIWKFFDLFTKSARTKKILGEVDGLLEDHRIDEALEATRNSDRIRGIGRILLMWNRSPLWIMRRLVRGLSRCAEDAPLHNLFQTSKLS